MNMYELKLKGDIHLDIDTVYDAMCYAKALIDGLVEEEIAKNNENRKRMGVFIEMLSIQSDIKKAVESARRLRWEEEKYCFGPLAGRKDMPF